MCGRYVIDPENEEHFFEHFGADAASDFKHRYNVAPTQQVPIIRASHDAERGREAVFARWGLVPGWAKDLSIGSRMINCRSESASEKPSFKKALGFRRCIVPATAFYEWQPVGKIKQPWCIHRIDRAPLAFAGLWEIWNKGEDGPLESCTIMTTSASDDLEGLHDRMPVILEPADFARWLDPAIRDHAQVADLLKHAPVGTLTRYKVSTAVNSVRNHGPELVKPLEDLFGA